MSVLSNVANHQTSVTGNDGVTGKTQIQSALEVNACRVMAVVKELTICAKSSDQHEKFHHLCLALSRGIDYGLANNELPAHASKLPPVLKMVCSRKNEFFLQAAIMVPMISVKNACKLGWFSAKDTEELLTLADEVASFFVTKKDVNTKECNLLPTISTIMSRFYPRFKLGHIITSLEVEPGYGTHLVDFHISKDLVFAKEEKIFLLVAMKDNIDTSSCIVTPQQANILLNGNAVDHRNKPFMDSGPQLPTSVNRSLKYGINLLQVVGQFNGHYIFMIALMSVIPSSGLPIPQDYDQPVSAALSSDSEIIEGPSRVTLNCPISKIRIRTPVKGNFCKHYQCFDLSNYVEMNLKRPNWRCPSCNQSVCFTDLRVDQKMVKVLKEVGENVSEVIISVDGSWTAVSSDICKDESHDKTSVTQQEGHMQEPSILDAPGNMLDLTGEDDEMDTADQCEPIDTKPIVHHDVQGRSVPSNLTVPPISRSTAESTQYSSVQAANVPSPGAMLFHRPANLITRSQAPVGGSSATSGNGGMTPVLTDAVSPALSRQPENFQRTNNSMNPIYAQLSAPAPTSLQLQEAIYSQAILNNMNIIPRNVTRVSSAIQALPVQMPTTNPQQHLRPTQSLPAASGSPAPFQGPVAGSNAYGSSPFGNNVERQRHHSQLLVTPPHLSNMASVPPQNRAVSLGGSLSIPSHNMYMHQTLSQPPHMRTSQRPRNQIPHETASRMGFSNSPSTLQRIQLGASNVRPPQTMPLQTQPVRMTSSLPLNSGVAPQAVSRAENLIDLQSDVTWRPTGRMRGALTGEAYSAALSQYMGQAAQAVQTPSPRPSVSAPSPNLQVLLANRRIASEMQNKPATGAATFSGTVGTQPEGSHGVN